MEPLSEQAQSLKKGIYTHFKGNQYRVLGVARHSESLDEMVVYQALYGDNSLWVRPLVMFSDEIQKGDAIVPRFRYVGEE